MSALEAPLIAHVINRLDIGGLENGLVNLINRMPPDRYGHAVICLRGFSKEFSRRISRPHVEIFSLDKRPGKDIGCYGRMWRLLRRLRPDIVHTRNLGTVDMQWVAAAARIPLRVHGEHGWEAVDPKGLSPRGIRIRRACRPVVGRWVPMSRDIARWLEQSIGIAPSNIRQLYSGVDTQRFRPPNPGQRRTDEPDDVVIGTVGRLDPVKNQESLLRTFAVLRDRFPRSRLVIVGDGPLRQTLEGAARHLGVSAAVTFAGARDDTPDLMRSFDVFVLPSHNEGISNTILEAMATGLPVVAAKIGGNPELIMDGVTGGLYDPAASDGMASALLPYLADRALRQAVGAAGRRRVVQNFSLDSMVQRYLDLYDELISPVPPLPGQA